MSMPWTIDDKVAFLKRPESYSCRPSSVEAIETHMAWVFLTNEHAYKLKKPVRYEFLDFSTVEARRVDCLREVQLNRRLARGVYLGVVRLTGDASGTMQIDGEGEPIDWLVKMRKLPRARMLDQAIRDGTVRDSDVRQVAKLLCDFYRRSPAAEIGPSEYVRRLENEIQGNCRELAAPSFGLPRGNLHTVVDSLRRFVQDAAELLEARARGGYVIDAHGDLRPEHICLQSPPVIIDCLEFNRDFRLLDTASEMSFLTLECDRLGGQFVSDLLWSTYLAETGDRVPKELRSFYRSHHALTRAKIAIWHLRDSNVRRPDSWKPKAERYLELAAKRA